MLTQRKRKRTIEDFNQFCTFVLAHAGYIPFPTEEWQSKDNVPRENIACIPQHGADWACFSSSSDSLCAPAQTKSWAEVHPGEELKKGGFKEKKKRREQEKSVLQRERKPWRSEGHARKTKTSTHNKAMKDPQFKRAKGNILCKRFSAEGTSPEVDSNGDADFKPVSTSLSQSRHQPLSEDCRCMDVRVERPPVFKQEPTTEYCRNVPEIPKENLTGETGVRRQPGCRIPARLTGDIPERREEKEHEVAVELLGPASTSQTDCMQKREMKPEEWEEERQRRSREAPWEDGGLKMENERDEEGWERSAAGGTDILCLVMERRLGQLLPEDQETGYHTEWDGSTPDQGGSDSDQATTPTAHCDTAASSAYGTEDMATESSKMEDDDSWDLITCFCLKPFAGRPMIECSECGTWVHLSCAKIRRTHVPDVFVCQPCRDAKQNIRRSSRPRTAPRKRFSD